MNAFCTDILKWQKKPGLRKKDGVFIVEGIRMFSEIPTERLRGAVLSESFARENEALPESLRKAGTFPVYVVKDGDFERISDTKTPQGILAVVKAFSYTEEEVFSDENGVYVLLENLQDPGNLGTIFRSAEAAGISGVIMDEACCDVYNPKVIRSTMGSFLRMKFIVVPDLKETVRNIKARGGRAYAAALQGSVPYDTPDYRGLSAFLIGNEAKGLTEELIAASGEAVRIPMSGRVESLNAAMAATILMYEAKRQRK